MAAESCENAAFQSCFSLLQEGLQHELSTIAPMLYAERVISSEIRDKSLMQSEPPLERSAHLLSVLESKIRFDPASFHSIIRVLDSSSPLQILAAKLQSNYERCKGESSEVSTVEVHGASASFTTSSRPAYASPTVLRLQQQIAFSHGRCLNFVVLMNTEQEECNIKIFPTGCTATATVLNTLPTAEHTDFTEEMALAPAPVLDTVQVGGGTAAAAKIAGGTATEATRLPRVAGIFIILGVGMIICISLCRLAVRAFPIKLPPFKVYHTGRPFFSINFLHNTTYCTELLYYIS